MKGEKEEEEEIKSIIYTFKKNYIGWIIYI